MSRVATEKRSLALKISMYVGGMIEFFGAQAVQSLKSDPALAPSRNMPSK